jgi:ribosomal protein S18 acetylase RimI-like enzyme
MPGEAAHPEARHRERCLDRAYAFLERADMAGERTENSPVGEAVFDEAVPRRLDSNYLHVKREADGETIKAEAERLKRRMIHVSDSELGERLAPHFKEQGWLVRRQVVMAQLREPEREANLTVVSEVEEPMLRAARYQVVTGEPWAKPEVMEQLFAAKALIGQRVTARHFAVVLYGKVVSYTDLYQDGADAQIEDVGTLQEHRKRGYASAVILTAIAEARKAGAEFVFLVADLEDWPKELYRRLGFDELGYYVKFIAPHT